MTAQPGTETADTLERGELALARAPDRGVAAASARPTLPARLVPTIWHSQSVRAQLLVTVLVIDVVAALIAGGVTILKARTSTRVEIAASMRLAEAFVHDAIDVAAHEAPAAQVLADLPLQQRFLRHVRIAVSDAAGRPVPPRTNSGSSDLIRGDERSPAPAWFAALIAPPAERREIPVIVKGQRIGTVSVLGEPSDEIAEVWENTLALSAVAAAVNLTVIAILYLLFGRVLGPLTALSGGLFDLEHRKYDVRLPRPGARELAAISDRFNALARALDAARTENMRLAARLITAQDDERRRTALELHDEVGPCLFGLKAYATSISTLADTLPETAARDLRERAGDMLVILERLQLLNRSLLKRLRPMALGHVPLCDLLADVVADRARQHPKIAFSFSPGPLRHSYDDAIDLTIYRCMQEGLTNAIRHANAARIEVDLAEATDGGHAQQLSLSVRDDGTGLAPDAPPGFGLTGMQERVAALGGTCVIAVETRGTRVHVTIPLAARTQDSAPA